MTEPAPTLSDLVRKKCKPCQERTQPMSAFDVRHGIKNLEGWKLVDDHLVRGFKFKDFYETVAFVNAVAWLSHVEDHHPELIVNYGTCEVRYQTHKAGGITDNDFICAAKVNAMLKCCPG